VCVLLPESRAEGVGALYLLGPKNLFTFPHQDRILKGNGAEEVYVEIKQTLFARIFSLSLRKVDVISRNGVFN
jgi:hypothetical protein